MKNIIDILKQSRKTIFVRTWIVIMIGFLIIKGILPGWINIASDFNNYYVSAKLVSEGKSIHKFYDNQWFSDEAQRIGIHKGAKFSPFPPITAYVYLPIVIFEPLTAKRIWLVLNVLILFFLIFRIRKLTKWSLIQASFFLTLFTVPLSSCLNFGQLYLVIGFLLFESLGQCYMRSKPRLLGLVIGALTSLKYLPIAFLGYILKHEKKYVILLYSFLGILIPFLIIYMLDNQACEVFFLDFKSHLIGDLPGQGKFAIDFQSIDSMLNNLFVYDQFINPFPILNLSILKPIIKYLLLGFIIGLLLIVFRKSHYQVTPTIVSIGVFGIFVMIPASASYHFLLLLWPILCLTRWLVSFQSKKALIIISIMMFITFTIQRYHIPNFNEFPIINILLHYPRFWGLLCVFLVLNYYYIITLNKSHG